MSQFNKQQIVDETLSKLNNARDGKILREVKPFLGGILYIVGFTDSDGELKENYVFEKNGQLKIYRFSYELYHGIAGEIETPSIMLTILRESSTDGVIAVILTITICYLAITGFTIP